MVRVLLIAALGYALGSPEQPLHGTVLGRALGGFREAVDVALVEELRLPSLTDLSLSGEVERAVAKLPFIVALEQMNRLNETRLRRSRL